MAENEESKLRTSSNDSSKKIEDDKVPTQNEYPKNQTINLDDMKIEQLYSLEVFINSIEVCILAIFILWNFYKIDEKMKPQT